MSNWYFEQGGQQQGPLVENELIRRLNTGELSKSSLVWKSGMAEWTKVESIAELSAQLIATPSTSVAPLPYQSSSSPAGEVNPYAAPQAHVGQAPEVLIAGERVDASRWARLGAALLDGVILIVATIILSFVFGLIDMNEDEGSDVMIGVLALVLYIVINGVFLYRDGQTLGKKIVGIQIIDYHSGAVPSLGASVGMRYILPQIIGTLCGIFTLVDVLMIFGVEKRCLHDKMANTRVVTKVSGANPYV